MLSKQTRFIIILFLLAIFSCSKPDTFLLRETIKVFPREGIDETNSHNAFTDLIYFKNKFYCAFRTGNKHVGDNGGILLMSSKDKVKWEKETFFQLEGVDLRDPKFVLDSEQNILSLHIGGSVFENKKWVRFNPVITNSHNGKEWTTLQSLNVQDRWLGDQSKNKI